MAVSIKAAWIRTFMGHRFHLSGFPAGEVDVREIAHALSNLCRFGGHCAQFYSVAQHSVLVSHIVPPALALEGLLHDAAEAYLGDVVRPLKRHLKGTVYDQWEESLEILIADRFGLRTGPHPELKEADNRALATEARDLMKADARAWGVAEKPVDEIIFPLPPRDAEARFLARFWLLHKTQSGEGGSS